MLLSIHSNRKTVTLKKIRENYAEFKAKMELFDCFVDELLPENVDALVPKQKSRRGFLCWKVK